MRNLDLFPPLPTMMQGSESITLDSTGRLRALRRSLDQTKPRPVKSGTARKSSLRAVTTKNKL